MQNAFIYQVAAQFKDKNGNYSSGCFSSYKSKASAKKRFEKQIASGVYDRIQIRLVNAVYLPEDEITIAEWEKA